jgi:uncharacterized protein (DUF305 family)
MSKMRTTLAAGTALLAALALAACSSTSGSMGGLDHGPLSSSNTPAATADSFNDQDVMFSQMMIAHHQQAIDMADMLLVKTGADAQVADLAKKIKTAQGPEITTMNGWLKTWGKGEISSGMRMSYGDGMMSDADMNALKAAPDADAGKLFLQQMTQHHQGAIDMAKTEAAFGKNAGAVALAKKIVTDQTAEITEMKSLLTAL